MPRKLLIGVALCFSSLCASSVVAQNAAEDREHYFTMTAPELPRWLADATWRETPPRQPRAEAEIRREAQARREVQLRKEAEIRRWIEQLGAKAHAEREAASKALAEYGFDAIELLTERGLTSKDPEVSVRARAALEAIGPKPKPEQVEDTDKKIESDLQEFRRDLQHGNFRTQLHQKSWTRRHYKQLGREQVAGFFAMRRHISNVRYIIGQTTSPEAKEALTWLRLLGVDRGTPAFAQEPSQETLDALRRELNRDQKAWIRRIATSGHPASRRQGRMWQALLLADDPRAELRAQVFGEDPLLGDLSAAIYRTIDREDFIAAAATHLKEAEGRAAILKSLDLYNYALLGGKRSTHNHLNNDRAALEVIAPHLQSTDPVVRAAAAISMFPREIKHSVTPNVSHSSRSAHLFMKSPRKMQDVIDSLAKKAATPEFAGYHAMRDLHPELIPKAMALLQREFCSLSPVERAAFHPRLPHQCLGGYYPADAPLEFQQRWLQLRILHEWGLNESMLLGAHANPQVVGLMRYGFTDPGTSYLPAVADCPPEAADGLRAACLNAMKSPVIDRRMRAARALVALGTNTVEAVQARDAALKVLHDSEVLPGHRVAAGLVLAALDHEESRDRRFEIWESVNRSADHTGRISARRYEAARALFAIRDDPRTRAYVTERVRTLDCGGPTNHKASTCLRCYFDKDVIAAMMWQWRKPLPMPAQFKVHGHLIAQVNFLLDPERSDWPNPFLIETIQVPGELRIDLGKASAERLDKLAGTTRFRAAYERGMPSALAIDFRTFVVDEGPHPFVPPVEKK